MRLSNISPLKLQPFSHQKLNKLKISRPLQIGNLSAGRVKTEEIQRVEEKKRAAHSELTKRILTSEGKRKYPKDFFSPDMIFSNNQAIIGQQKRTGIKKKIRTQRLEEQSLNQLNKVHHSRDLPAYNEFLTTNLAEPREKKLMEPKSLRKHLSNIKKSQNTNKVMQKSEKNEHIEKFDKLQLVLPLLLK